MTLVKYLILFSAVIYCCQSYKLLFLYHIPRGSHYILASKLAKELALHGHEVTFVTPFAQKNPVKNLREIYIGSPLEQLPPDKVNLFDLETTTPLEKAKRVMNFQYKYTEYFLKNEKVQEILKSEERYDAILMYQYLNDGMLGIANHFKVPLILFSSMPLYSAESFLLSHPTPPSYVPNILTEYTGHMNFWQRLRNTFYDTSIIVHYLWNILPKHRELVRQYIPGSPDLYNFVNNESLILINSHVSTNEAIPHVPNAVEVGGYHIEEPKPLPTDLQTFLDNSPNGVVLFSMGTISKSSDFPKHKMDALIKTFSKLKENVLWKWEDDNLPGLSKNVKIMKWIPQSDILAHPNVKLFISHGGLLSTMESVYYGVPIVGIPVFVDQKMNMAIAASHEYAVQVPYQDLTEENLSFAINEVLNKPKYRENVNKRSLIMRDRPIKPFESVLYWTDYVIRHQGARHLRYPGMDLTWFQRNLLDVALFVTLVTLVPIFVLTAIIKRILCGNSEINNKPKKE